MVKEALKKDNTKTQKDELQQILLENSISLQKVLTNLSINLDNLSKQVSRLLQLFEQSAKNIAEKDFESEMNTKKVMDKIDTLINQNKTLAQGVSLVHEKIGEQPSLVQEQKENYTKQLPSNTIIQKPQFPKQ